MRKTGNFCPWWRNGTLIWGAFGWRNGQIRGVPWWSDGENWGTRPLILFTLMGPKSLLRNFRSHASWKIIHGAPNLHCSYNISKIVWWFSMLILIFSVIYVDSRGYIGWAPVRVFEKFRSLFSFIFFLFFFFPFFFYSSFSFFPCLSGGPFSSGVPGHCPPMPPSRYATACSWLLEYCLACFISIYPPAFWNLKL